MQVVSEILCADMASMTVEDSKEAHLGPVTLPMLVFRLKNIQDNGDSILIVLSNNTLVGICSISLNYAAFLV